MLRTRCVADEAPEHIATADDDIVQADDLWLDNLGGREGQKLARKAGDTIGSVMNFPKVAFTDLVIGDPLGGQIGEVDDHGQHVIEVMGDPTYQPDEAVHLLRVELLLLAHG